MGTPYSIEIFVPDGDPEGLRIVSLKNWTGVGLVFQRRSWEKTKSRTEFDQTGVYVLLGHDEQDADLPILYIGQTDELRTRISSHDIKKEFWDRCVVFASSNNFLNRAHVTWLEWALHKRATTIGQCKLENKQVPQEPSLSEAERADMQAFYSQILQILPLISVRSFEEPQSIRVATHRKPAPQTNTRSEERIDTRDTLIVPAHKTGFEKEFLGNNCWFPIRISGGMLDKIKYIAAYQIRPTMAVTHIAEVDRILPYGDSGKYKLVFRQPAREIKPVRLGKAHKYAMQSHRYTHLDLLEKASTLADIL